MLKYCHSYLVKDVNISKMKPVYMCSPVSTMDGERRDKGWDFWDMEANQKTLTTDVGCDMLPLTLTPKSQWKGTEGEDIACSCAAI